ncbi:MAG TPA: DUF2065 domain-containing protein [Steroidobacteraceae bacterium]|nr:DUF2065 domain-containing protein [Steroidobacteraceae bacterium]
MSWSDLLAALALYLVLEGVLPFLNPQAMKRVLTTIATLPDRQLRLWGLASMVAGVLLLSVVRW